MRDQLKCKIFKYSVFPIDVTAYMDGTDRMHQRQTFKNSLLITIWASIYLADNSDPGVVFRVVLVITNIHAIKNTNVIDAPPPDLEPRMILTLPTEHTLPPNRVLRHTGILDCHPGVNLRNQSLSQYFFDQIPKQPFRCVHLCPRLFHCMVLETKVCV